MHAMWASVAGAWSDHATYVDRRAAGVTAALLDATDPRPGARVLELACGAGGTGLAAARRVVPGGEVVLSDVAPAMTAIAARRAAELGLDGVRTRTLDLEAIDEPDGAYDVVLCREGLMFASDPAAAVREVRRVLRAGGRAGIAVWGPRERNPWLGLVLDAAAETLGRPVPQPGRPGPFALEDRDRLADLLADAGFTDVAVEEVATPLQAPSLDEWWRGRVAMAGPLERILAGLPEEARAAMRDRARTAAARYDSPAGVAMPGVTLVASARA
jgi:SAM-dependent methyltransferase